MTRIVGILNLTPDSFAGGGAAESEWEQADVLDVGAESTRPGAAPVAAEEEWQRLAPFLHEAWPRLQSRVMLSMDTRHPETARRALALGAQWINDVSGFSTPEMIDAVRESGCMLVVMHSLTVPANPAVTLPESENVIETLRAFAQERIATLGAQGIAKERIVFDPGIGFGKTAEQSWKIIHHVKELQKIGVPLLIGHSRKSFLGGAMSGRDAATLEVSRGLIAAGVDYLRVHDVVAHRKLLCAS